MLVALAQWGDKWAAHEAGPSFAFIDAQTGTDVPRVWPRRETGEIIPLTDIRLRRPAAQAEE